MLALKFMKEVYLELEMQLKKIPFIYSTFIAFKCYSHIYAHTLSAVSETDTALPLLAAQTNSDANFFHFLLSCKDLLSFCAERCLTEKLLVEMTFCQKATFFLSIKNKIFASNPDAILYLASCFSFASCLVFDFYVLSFF